MAAVFSGIRYPGTSDFRKPDVSAGYAFKAYIERRIKRQDAEARSFATRISHAMGNSNGALHKYTG